MHAETICGMNVLSVRDAVRRAEELCLKGEGPVLIEAKTYRYWGHNFKDKGTAYRTDAEKEAWLKKRPRRLVQGAARRERDPDGSPGARRSGTGRARTWSRRPCAR